VKNKKITLPLLAQLKQKRVQNIVKEKQELQRVLKLEVDKLLS